MIPLMRTSQRSKINKDTKQDGGCKGWGKGMERVSVLFVWGSSFEPDVGDGCTAV